MATQTSKANELDELTNADLDKITHTGYTAPDAVETLEHYLTH